MNNINVSKAVGSRNDLLLELMRASKGNAKKQRQREKSKKSNKLKKSKSAAKPVVHGKTAPKPRGTFNLPKTSAKSLGKVKKKGLLIESAKRQAIVKDMSKTERRDYHLKNLYIPQFLERLNNYFGVASGFTSEQQAILRMILPRFNRHQLEMLVNYELGLEDVMYESSATYDESEQIINENFTADMLYDRIVGYAKQVGVINEEELKLATGE